MKSSIVAFLESLSASSFDPTDDRVQCFEKRYQDRTILIPIDILVFTGITFLTLTKHEL